MKYLISLILINTLLISGCGGGSGGKGKKADVDNTAPILSEPSTIGLSVSHNPEFTFESDESGTIIYYGGCSSINTNVVAGTNVVVFDYLSNGDYTQCSIIVFDASDNYSNNLQVPSFTIDDSSTIPPDISEKIPVSSPSTNLTPSYGFYSTEAGLISYGGDCSSSTTSIDQGLNIIVFNALNYGSYTNCTISVTDNDDNISNILNVSDFDIIELLVEDIVAPIIAEVSPVITPTDNTTPSYTFSSNEAGSITYSGDCSSAATSATVGSNLITFSALSVGAHNNCTIKVTDSSANTSTALNVSSFEITDTDTTAPILSEVTPVITPTDNTTPSYTFSSNEAGSITYSGDCSSAATSATIGSNLITFNTLDNGIYSNCTIRVKDASNNTSLALVITEFTIEGAIQFIPLNDTGVTTCGNYAYTDSGTYAVTGSDIHSNVLNCTTVGATQSTDGTDGNNDVVRAGQDALYGRDVINNDNSDGYAGFSFTKLDANGSPLAASASSWSCVQDNVTGLIWEVKATSGLQNKLNTYTWYNSTGINDGSLSGTASGGVCSGGTGCDTEKFVADINAQGLCGANDWVLPTKEELQSITYDRISPTVDTNYFPNTIGSDYFSASPISNSSGGSNVWVVNFYWGSVSAMNKNGKRYVRLVRRIHPLITGAGCTSNRDAAINITKPDSMYTVHGDGTVTDKQTNLMWQKCSLGLSGSSCATGSAQTHTWQAALKVANDNADYGYSDWRLPNVKELSSLVDVACHSPSINDNVFPNTVSNNNYWSASPDLYYYDDRSWIIGWKGNVSTTHKNNAIYVRLVRSIQ